MSGLRRRFGAGLGTRDRRALLVGGLVLIPAFVFRFGIQPYIAALGEAREQLRAERQLLARELSLLARAHELPGAFQAGTAALLERAPRLFDGADPTLIAADMQAYVDRVARLGRVVVQRMEIGRADTVGTGVTGLRLDLRGQGDLEGLLTFLRLLDEGPKLVHVERLAISPGRPGGRLPPGDYEVLDLQMSLKGFTLTPPQQAAPGDAGFHPSAEGQSIAGNVDAAGASSALGGSR